MCRGQQNLTSLHVRFFGVDCDSRCDCIGFLSCIRNDHKRTKTCPLVKTGKTFSDLSLREYLILQRAAQGNVVVSQPPLFISLRCPLIFSLWFHLFKWYNVLLLVACYRNSSAKPWKKGWRILLHRSALTFLPWRRWSASEALAFTNLAPWSPERPGTLSNKRS